MVLRVSADESAVLSVAEHAGVTNDSLKPHCQHTHTHKPTDTQRHGNLRSHEDRIGIMHVYTVKKNSIFVSKRFL